MRRDRGDPGGESGASYVGGTLYFRKGRIRDGLFYGMYFKMCVLSDIKILKQIHSLGDEQYKRLMAYMKALQKLEAMESIVEEQN